jgi:AraC-like DNA-binding protein
MTLELGADTVLELLGEAAATATSVASTRQWPARVGRGTFDRTQIRPGMVLYVLDLAPAGEILMHATPEDGYLEYGISLGGHTVGTIAGFSDPIRVGDGQRSAVVAPRRSRATARFVPRYPVVNLSICFTAPALTDLISTPESFRAERWLNALESDRPLVETPEPLTLGQGLIARQILACPYSGNARRLFLESKVLELLAAEIAPPVPPGHQNGLAAEDSRIRTAACILLSRLEDPPGLRGLAREVGTNEFNLKQGFRRVFGTTVFGYLRAHRLQLALQLLADSQISVEEVASRVGYACPSRFASAFRRQFATTPSAFRRAR